MIVMVNTTTITPNESRAGMCTPQNESIIFTPT